MSDYEKIESLKEGEEKEKEIIEYYTNIVKVDDWMNLPFKNSIIRFANRTEYKKNGKYHRLNGPAIDYNGHLGDFYINGVLFTDIELWKKTATLILRKVKLKKLNQK